jgi:hypothetical protein
VSLPSERIVSLSFERRYDELESLLRVQRGSSSEENALVGLSDALREKLEQLEKSDSSIRYLLAGLAALAFNLMDYDYWDDAELALNELLRLSLAHSEAFFLADTQLRQAACLKALGRMRDFENMKAQIPAGTRFLMKGKFWHLEDL